MPLVPFDSLPASAKLWIFAAERPIESDRLPAFYNELNTYLDVWQAHGKAIAAGRELRYGQFLMIAADENVEAPSGCSIDALTREVVAIGKNFGVNFLSSALLSYREGDLIHSVERTEFKKLAESGRITLDTIVFDHSLTQLHQLAEHKWELPASESWHSKAFRFPIPA